MTHSHRRRRNNNNATTGQNQTQKQQQQQQYRPPPPPPTPPDVNELLTRDFVITQPSRYKFVYVSEGPPRTEIHLATTATMHLPDHKLCCKLSDDVIPDLVEARVQTLQQEQQEHDVTDSGGDKKPVEATAAPAAAATDVDDQGERE